MKSRIVEFDQIAPKYPYLGISKHGDFIVLFEAWQVGIVIWSKPNVKRIGFHCQDWDEDNFKPFDGEVILSN